MDAVYRPGTDADLRAAKALQERRFRVFRLARHVGGLAQLRPRLSVVGTLRIEQALAAAAGEEQVDPLAVALDDCTRVADADLGVAALFVDQHLFGPRPAAVFAPLHQQIDVAPVFSADLAALEEQEHRALVGQYHHGDAVGVIPVGFPATDIDAEVGAVFGKRCRCRVAQPQGCEKYRG